MGGTWLAQGAVKANSSLAIRGHEAEGGCSSQRPDRDELVHRGYDELGIES